MKLKRFSLVFVILITVLCLSCSTEETNSAHNLTSDSFTLLPLEPVFEFTESDDVAFRVISSIKTDSYGNIIVHYFRQPFLFMFDGDGNFLKRIGKEGRGPGEFQQITSFIIGRDNLWVIDNSSIKIEKFNYTDGEYAHTKSISLEKEELAGRFLGKTDEGILIDNTFKIYANRKVNPTERPISLINENGNILRDSIIMVPLRKQLRLKGSEITLTVDKVFGNQSLLAFDGKEHVYMLWSDSLAVDSYTIGGDRRRVFSHALQPVQVTEQERDSVLNRYDPVRTDMRRNLPEIKPLVKNFLIDNEQRVWVEMSTVELGHGWFGFSKEGEPLYKIDIPKAGAKLQEISGNRVFWSYLNENGLATFSVSKIKITGR